MHQVQEFISYAFDRSDDGRARTRSRHLARPRIAGSLAALLFLIAVSFAQAGSPSIARAAGTAAPATTPPLGFALPGSHGYQVEVYGAPAIEGEPAQVIVRAATRNGAVTYRFPGIVEEGAIHAELGALGEIAVTFRPISGGSSVAEAGCVRHLSSVAGWYEGTISFHAEGLTSVEASRAEGDDGLALSVMCAGEPEAGKRPPGTYLDLSGGPRGTNLTALRDEGGFAAQIEVGVTEVRGGVPIERSISIAAGAEAFRHLGLRSATLSPPAPFSGSATFVRDGGRTRLNGNLRVDFPGRPGVALTGPGVEAQLSRVRR
jgi:hypothetical protein